MRAVSTCPAGVMGWSLGAPTQPSARTTQGSYFNRNGILKFAPPGVLRPNYVYQNGVWVLDGYLKEGQSTNYFCPTADVTMVDGMPGVVTAAQSTWNYNPTMATPTDTPAVVSCLLKRAPGTTGTCSFWWGSNWGRPILSINPDDGTVTGNTTYYNASCSYLGNGWSYFVGYFNSPTNDGWIPPWFPSDGFYKIIMVEYGTKPTSWIPYGQTRTSD